MSVLKVDSIQNTGGTTALTIDSSGALRKNVIPSFSAYAPGGGGDVTYSAGANISADMTATHHNDGGHYKTSGGDVGKFVAPFDGLYYFTISLYRNNSGDKRVYVIIENNTFTNSEGGLNNAQIVNGQGRGNSSGDNYEGSGIVKLSAGAKAYVSNSYDTTTIFQHKTHSLFQGYLIG